MSWNEKGHLGLGPEITMSLGLICTVGTGIYQRFWSSNGYPLLFIMLYTLVLSQQIKNVMVTG